MLTTFRICTFVNDERQYSEMQASFRAAGFAEPRAVYQRLSDAETQPYAAVNALASSAEPYVLLVHQDVRCDQGDGIDTLEGELERLTGLDPCWAVAGNAGAVGRNMVIHIEDPNGSWRSVNLPARVSSLDENLLILRTARRPRCTPALSGFHLYGTDVCLNAIRDGSSCYVISFLVKHLSVGSHVGLRDAIERFAAVWSGWLPRYIRVSFGSVALARPAWLRRLMQRERVRRRLYGWPLSASVTWTPPLLAAPREHAARRG